MSVYLASVTQVNGSSDPSGLGQAGRTERVQITVENSSTQADQLFFTESGSPALDNTGARSIGADSLFPSENLVGASAGIEFLRYVKGAAEGRRAADPRDSGPPLSKTADRLLQTYWDYADVIFPLLDRPAIDAAYESLWSNSEGTPINERVFHCLLNLMFAISCSVGIESGPQYHSAHVFYERARNLMSFNLLEVQQFETIQILLLTALYLQHNDQPQPFCHSVSLAVHVAQELGLQFPATIHALANPRDRELAQRVWLGCIMLDRTASMTFGCKLKISQDAAKEAVHPHGEQEPPSLTHLGRSINMDVYLISCQLHHILGDVLEAFYMARNNFLTRGQSDASPESSPRAAMTPKVLASLFQIEASLLKCTQAALDIIKFIFDKSTNQSRASSVYALPSDWYNVSYVYMAATVLIAAQLFPKILEQIPIVQLNGHLQQAYAVLQDREPYTEVARKCRNMLSFLQKKISSHHDRTGDGHRADMRRSRPSFSRDLQPAEDIHQAQTRQTETRERETGEQETREREAGNREAGRDNLCEMAEWPLFWDQWPLSLLPLDDDIHSMMFD
ncbi:hypothetical protein N7509_008154 [Penicillium cosmopolitanum]|uniref:Xylanolytic transcriptional activator regulatory domain-containing protein n=1 Tax=Penicillium cosmopolitanum TaxID=1131564 RepID=A0A9W9W0B2_9EURO|nr:uncharacterized protein N7509_008154 [Penicillium cosmopolitanum]KAJ5392664.1 hypothetical protein N7509_008154 [Penicillium cosmopolitanum]